MAGIDLPGGLFPKEEIDEDSGVPLSDWKGIINKGTLTIGGGTACNGYTTIYTVPAKKTLYLTSAELVGLQTGIVNTLDSRFIIGPNANYTVLKLSVIKNATVGSPNAMKEIVMMFPVPLKIVAGTTLQVYSNNANGTSYAYFSGYLI